MFADSFPPQLPRAARQTTSVFACMYTDRAAHDQAFQQSCRKSDDFCTHASVLLSKVWMVPGFIKRKESSVHGARRKSMTGPTRAPVKSGLTKIGHVDKDVPAAATMVEDTNLNEEFSMHFFASRTDRASTLPSGWEIDRTFRKTQLDVVKSMPKVSVSQASQQNLTLAGN